MDKAVFIMANFLQLTEKDKGKLKKGREGIKEG